MIYILILVVFHCETVKLIIKLAVESSYQNVCDVPPLLSSRNAC